MPVIVKGLTELWGTALQASKLATARTIGGVAFDGTANINLPGVNTAGNQSTTGNAATATKLATARTISGVAFDGTANITLTAANVGAIATTGGTATGNITAPDFIQSSAQSTNAASCTRKDYVDSAIAAGDALQVSKTGDTMTGGLTFANADCELGWVFNTDYAKIGFKNTADGDTDSYMWFKTGDNGNEYFKWQGVSGANTADWMSLKSTGLVVAAGVTAPTFTGALAGNAATATKLATARTIGGVAFDGTANINLPGVNTAGNQSTTGNAATATKLATARNISGVQFDGSADITLSAANVGAAPVGFGLGTYGTSISTVLGDCNLRRQSGFFQGSTIAGIPNGAGWTYLFNQAHGNAAGYFGYLAISFAGTQAWIGGQEGGTQKGPYELVKRGDSILTGRVEVNAGTNPMLEYHIPGKTAVCTYVDGAGNYRLATSNGGGGEVALRFQADTGGGLYVVGNGNFNDVNIRSDRRLKKNFVKISGALDKVSQLCAYTYDKKQSLSSNDYSTHEVGLIAQDVQLVLPEAVTEAVNPVDNLKVLTISNSGVNALLVEAIKELTDRVKYLESKIN